jgi:hypothetical protein
MPNPSMSNIPGIGAMTDTLDFVKNLWGGMSVPGMGIPGMIMPTLSVEEINKQISDLKAVESWLTLNMNMLRSTIQALEVQSATISTLQSMSATLSAAIKPNSDRKEATPASEKAAEPPVEAPKSAATSGSEPASKPTPSTKDGGADASSEAPIGNPAIWWNMLQDQFKQAVNTAMASEAPAAARKTTAKKPETKAAVKKASTPRPRKTPKTAE